ncbi:MAG: riboflavin synthase subunit alpha [Pseudomonadota bacterium]|jgi:riboflavin synthase
MFSGIIAAVGQVEQVVPRNSGVRLTIHAGGLDLSDVALGDSIACNGVCLTVVELVPTGNPRSFVVDVSDESLRCATGLVADAPLNLEKALRLADRLGGHLVTGHVDGIGRVAHFAPTSSDAKGDWLLTIEAPDNLAPFIARKGSVTVNGTSLTVNTVDGRLFSINLIPHTLQNTMLHTLTTGALVNLEIDVIARYCERLLSYTKS